MNETPKASSNNSFHNNSIRIRRVSRDYVKALSISVLLVCIILIFNGYSTYRLHQRHLEAEGIREVEAAARRLDQALHRMIVVLDTIAIDVEDFLSQGNASHAEVETFLQNKTNRMIKFINPQYVDLYMAKPGWYACGNNWTPPEGYRPEERPWFKLAVSAGGKTVIQPPYKAPDYPNPMIAVCRLMTDGKTVLSMDVNIKDFLPKKEHTTSDEDKSIFYIAPEGNAIDFMKDDGEHAIDSAFVSRIVASPKAMMEIDDENGPKIVFTKVIHDNWLAVVAIEKQSFLASAWKSTLWLLALSVILLSFIGVYLNHIFLQMKMLLNETKQLERYRADIARLLENLAGEPSEDKLKSALAVIGNCLNASRCNIIQYDTMKGKAALFLEHVVSPHQKPMPPDMTLNLDDTLPWYQSLRRDGRLYIPNVNNASAIVQLGLDSSIAKTFEFNSLYACTFNVSGKLWGSVGISFKDVNHALTEAEEKYVSEAVSFLALSMERLEHTCALEKERARREEEVSLRLNNEIERQHQIEGLNQKLQLSLKHTQLRADALEFVSSHLDMDEILDYLAKRLLKLTDCDQILYMDKEQHPRFWNSENVPPHSHETCVKCPLRDLYIHQQNHDCLVVMDVHKEYPNVPEDCHVKSAVARHVFCNDESVGVFAIRYINKVHEMTDVEQSTFADIIELVNMALSRERNQQKILEEHDLAVVAEAANKAKTVFLNNMSHDIRTPMNAIIGFTNLAISHIDNTEQVRNYLTKISQSSKHLLSLINDVLDMSRIESGKMTLTESEENLPEIIHTLHDIVQADMHAKQLEFFIDSTDVNDENIVCDKLRLNQILLNVLSNAIKYTQPGGKIEMRISEKPSQQPDKAFYEFRIKDNGMGMSEEFQKKIYEPFTRVNNSTVSGIQGTGLGMAITKRIIDMMGGTIAIKSQERVGTEITLTFEFTHLKELNKRMELPDFKGLRSLVVDDDVSNCMNVSKMLKDLGLRSDWRTSGHEAIQMMEYAIQENDCFNLFFIDLQMPGMSGIETVRRLRRHISDDARVFIMTAYDWGDIEEEAREAGVTAFISKPIFPSEIVKVLCTKSDANANQSSTLSHDFNGKKVLLVEDNELNREIATEILEENGFQVDVAVDGSYAVEKMKTAKSGDYDLILMDVQMPIMNGYEATKRIRAMDNDFCKTIPIIAMTANAFEEDKMEAFAAGMNAHIAKPIKINVLMATLKEFTNKTSS
ncbi:MAG: response regulator [Lentisphaeria bacterium]|nr:response regulator [Lentisphaeria bacterium]